MFTAKDQLKKPIDTIENFRARERNDTNENIVPQKSIPPEKPPRNKPEAQKSSTAVENTGQKSASKQTLNIKAHKETELDIIGVIDTIKKTDLTETSNNDSNHKSNLEAENRVRTSSSTSSLASRDNNLPIKSLPGPPIPDRPLRTSLSCLNDLATVGVEHEEFHQKDNSLHRRGDCRMARSSSRLFSACISGQKDSDEEVTTMKLRRSTSEGKVSKDQKNASRAIKSRSVHFDGNGKGNFT